MSTIRFLLALSAFSSLTAGCPSSLGTFTPSYPTSSPKDRPLQLSGPHRCVDNVCVYADPKHGSGLAVVTTSENAALLESLPVHDRSHEVTSPPPFYESYVLGKGIGLIANATIRRGDTLMAHTPTLLVHWATHAEAQASVVEGLYQAAVQKLPATARRRFLRQMLIGGSGIHANVETNCFRFFVEARDEATGHLGCYPPSARLNHDCRPNLVYRTSGITQTIVAVRDIQPGEELSVSYVDLLLSRAERQERLKDWGFECSCKLCTNETASAEADKHVHEIAALKERLDSPGGEVDANTGIELAILYEDEGLWTYIGQHAYTRAALNCALFAEEACAVAFANKAMAALLVEIGETAGDLDSMWRLATDPVNHWAWGLRLRSRKTE